MSVLFNVADLVDPADSAGRTYREVNAAKSHSIPLGALVEDDESGVRLFVVYRGRDCDQTPLYWLSPRKDDSERLLWTGGYSEDGLTVIRLP